MKCYCCDCETTLTRKVQLRPHKQFDPLYLTDELAINGPDSAAYAGWVQEMTYRWAFICIPCYRLLDNDTGAAEIPGRGSFNIAGKSRRDKAPVVDDAKYLAFQKKEAAKMGIDV